MSVSVTGTMSDRLLCTASISDETIALCSASPTISGSARMISRCTSTGARPMSSISLPMALAGSTR